ncbi:MAG: hypothetical protein OXU77_06620 [Gammaproteobacteria bacterium]|nr:hypothetical protein [Gammaproteobacteria bacterium]MDE0441227.1 hypothetical protein [Gammaproteobacteria bacterium]
MIRRNPVGVTTHRLAAETIGRGLSPPAPDIVAAAETGRDKPVPYGVYQIGDE